MKDMRTSGSALGLDLSAVLRLVRGGTWAKLPATVQQAAAATGGGGADGVVDSSITGVHRHGATLARDTGGWIELHT